MVNKDTTSSFDELLRQDNTFTIHRKIIPKLAIEMYKVNQKMAPNMTCDLFKETEHPYNLRSDHTVRTYIVKTLQYVVFCAIWYHLYDLKNVKNTHEGVLLLLKVALLHGCFSRFLNCTNGTKSRNAPHMRVRFKIWSFYNFFF